MTLETGDKYYLGRIVDPATSRTTSEPLLLDPDDLTTHGVVVGMTGSGKTGLCIDLLEEAALAGLPALLIDPKGDITNALLHFPELRPQDFQPWVNAEAARREDKSVEQAAGEAAEFWRNGLQEWGIEPDRIRRLAESVRFTVFTPGSDAGVPVSILASLEVPDIPWEGNREVLLERISGTVTAILGLVGLADADPVQSREHILLSKIFESAWSEGKDLDLGELILQAQNPPFDRLGVFDINTFFPQNDRFALAMRLNNLLAAPGFQNWIEGQPLDVSGLLFTPEGKPRHSVFYIAHLSESERMFFVTLLFSAVETWMRAQPGTGSLRALLYFDEIFGYLPPTANPPSKTPMLRMLKQARAFGVGLLLATQNPVDVDYKALSNAGAWFIGKLQTEQDRARLLDGLAGAGGGFDRGAYERLIAGLGKRVFLLHNVHEKEPLLFQTRWAMNYLAGPLTRPQLRLLNELAAGSGAAEGALPESAAPAAMAAAAGVMQPKASPLATPAQGGESALPGSLTRPAVPAGVDEYFLPLNLSVTEAARLEGLDLPPEASGLGFLYRPAVLAQAEARFLQRKYNLDYDLPKTALSFELDRRGRVDWEKALIGRLDPRLLEPQPAPEARFSSLEAPLSDPKIVKDMQVDFLDWCYRSSEVVIRANETLDLYSGPEVSPADFREMCAEEARKRRDDEAAKLGAAFDQKILAVQKRIQQESRELDQDEEEHSQRRMEELGTHVENVAGLFGLGRKRRLTTSLSKRRMTAQSKADIQESKDAIAGYQKEIARLEAEKQAALDDANSRWGEAANAVSEIPVAPLKKDVLLDLFGVGWVPYHLIEMEGGVRELPGYSSE
jgi:hypothetical protein